MSPLPSLAGVLITFIVVARASRTLMRRDDISASPPIERNEEGCTCEKCEARAIDYWECDRCIDAQCRGNVLERVFRKRAHCRYDSVSAYENQPAAVKREVLWKEVLKTKNERGPEGSAARTLRLAISSSMRPPFDNHRDTMVPGRPKGVHMQGAVCKFDLTIHSDSPYTGSLAPGTHPGLLRISSATPMPVGLLPSVAVKFLRNGRISDNTVAIAKGEREKEKGWFDFDLSNHIEPPFALRVLQKFQQASGCTSMTGLSSVCTYNETGLRAAEVLFPFEISFRPHSDVKQYSGVDLDTLATIPAGKVLWELWATASPAVDAPQQKLGFFKTTSQCHISSYGDEILHFKHQRLEEDMQLRPEWVDMLNALKPKGCTASTRDSSEWMCGKD